MTRFLLGLFMALPMMGFAQSNFQKGYLITNKKDTLQGWIDYRERSHNPTSVTFSADGRTATKTYTLQDCAEFHINDIVTYRRFLVDISTASNEFSYLTEKIDESFRTDTVFLEVLQSGSNVALYSYADPIKKRFYIQDKVDTVPVELIRELYHQKDDASKVIVNVKYARQLMELLRKYGKWSEVNEKRLSTMNYNNRDLIKVVSIINDSKDLKMESSKYPKSRWFAGLSLDVARTKFTGAHVLATKDSKSKTAANPMISGGIDVFVNPAIRKLIFRAELSLSKSKSEVSNAKGFDAFDIATATVISGILFHLYNADNFKVYLNGNIGLNFSKYSNQVSYKIVERFSGDPKVDNSSKLLPVYVAFPVNIGVVLNKKIEILTGYNFSSSQVQYLYQTMRRQRVRVGVNYLFGK